MNRSSSSARSSSIVIVTRCIAPLHKWSSGQYDDLLTTSYLAEDDDVDRGKPAGRRSKSHTNTENCHTTVGFSRQFLTVTECLASTSRRAVRFVRGEGAYCDSVEYRGCYCHFRF